MQINYSNQLLASDYECGSYLKRSARSPQAQPGHVGHVARLRRASSTRVDDTSLGELVLQFQHSEAGLGGLRGADWAEILSAVTLVEHNLERELRKRHRGSYQVTGIITLIS